jgi:ribosomal protein S18 acetylase RimI-like enzyme
MGHQLETTIVPVNHGDETLIQEIFDGMSLESRFYRFIHATPVLTRGMRRLLADVDGTRHRAWSAHADGRPVGIVRLVADQTGDIELSVSVVDAVHRRGVGRSLVETALRAAADAGVEHVTVLVHPENRASITLFRQLGGKFRYEFGLLVGEVPARQTQAMAA